MRPAAELVELLEAHWKGRCVAEEGSETPGDWFRVRKTIATVAETGYQSMASNNR